MKRSFIFIIGLFLITILTLVNSGHQGSPDTFIGEGGIGWEFIDIDDPLEEMDVYAWEVSQDVIELGIEEHQFSTTGNNYKWDMALCNVSGSGLRYQNEDAQGGFNNSVWLDVPYGNLINYGLNETWCAEQNNLGYVLFSSGSKNQLPKKIRLDVSNLTNHTIYLGTGSAQLISTANASALLGTAENLCKDYLGNFRTAWEGPDDDLWYGNSSDGGLTWDTKEIFTGTVFNVGIICPSGPFDNVTVIYADGRDIDYVESDDLGSTFSSPKTALDQINPLNRPSCAKYANITSEESVIYCFGIDGVNQILYLSNSTGWNTEIGLPNQSLGNGSTFGDIEVDIEGNVFIVSVSKDTDGTYIWSSKDGFASRHDINLTLGNVGNNNFNNPIGIAIDRFGQIVHGSTYAGDLNICIGNTTEWDGGPSKWACQETSPLESRKTDTAITLSGEFFWLHNDDNVQATSDILRTNTSDNGSTFSSRVNIQAASAFNPTIGASLFPIQNRLNNSLPFAFNNDTAVYFNSIDINPPSSCVWLGFDWYVEFEDNCVVSEFMNLTGYDLFLIGATGTFNITSIGNLIVDIFTFNTSSGDGDSVFNITGDFKYKAQ